jgi:dTDP-4-dehydrorhamnose 3,5-epimerase-like enzyme
MYEFFSVFNETVLIDVVSLSPFYEVKQISNLKDKELQHLSLIEKFAHNFNVAFICSQI